MNLISLQEACPGLEAFCLKQATKLLRFSKRNNTIQKPATNATKQAT